MASTQTDWYAIRESVNLSQREIERRLGWKRGYLSWIERGARPSASQEAQLRTLYAALLSAHLQEGA